ncbi:hypothetical protein BESB_047930 [Besnoitia besnoiti]|uniref:Transmembrane protein n=1 Tax=Besnoitia besnoiti TaxID=94643 RepID=A0A2A9MK15_BESBE|nr:hypothetical protein BESB_047930 [Besnoitia besnoiti]PFH36601.1 hypothetical protein BESB_047930 [Besnoitia besnoiti]
MAATMQESSERLVESPDDDSIPGVKGASGSGFSALWDFPARSYAKYFDEEETKQFRQCSSCLMLQWVLNVLCNVGNFALALAITLHPKCLDGRFSWSTVHTSINLLVLTVSMSLGIAGLRHGSPSKLFQACAGHLLLSAYELLLFARDLCIISFSTERDQIYVYFRGGESHRALFTGVCATAGVSCLLSIVNAYKLRKLTTLLHKALPEDGTYSHA